MKYTNIYNASGMLEAESIRIFLESAGIHAFITQESAGISLGLTFGPLGNAKIFVDETQADGAVDLIKKMEAGQFIDDGIDNPDIDDDQLSN